MSSQPNESTPEPVKAAAATVGSAVTALIGLLGGAVALGLITNDQADIVTTAGNTFLTDLPTLATAITVISTIVGGLAASLATAWHARKKVIPTDSDVFVVAPADPATGPLTTP